MSSTTAPDLFPSSRRSRNLGSPAAIAQQLAPNENEHQELHADAMHCVRVLIAEPIVLNALASRSKQPLIDRLPDKHPLAGGAGIA